MDRRRMLQGSVGAAGVAGLGLTSEGCAHQSDSTMPEFALPDPATIENVINSMDRRLAWIDQHQLSESIVPPPRQPLSAERQAYADKCARVFRQSIRTLYVTGRFMDLPDEIKVHPEVQARVLAAQPGMDEAVFGTTELLESLTPDDHRMIQATLRARPQLGEQVAAMLEAPAREDGIPFRRRMSLRTSTLQLADRMSTQSPTLTIDPYVRRVRKLEAQPHSESRTARLLAARMGEEAFWRHQQHLEKISSHWQQQIAQAGPAHASPAQASPAQASPTESPPPAFVTPSSASPASPAKGPTSSSRPPNSVVPVIPSAGHQTLSTGGKIMGFGAGSVGVGLIFAGLNSAFASEAFLWPALIFGVTVGPILLVVGLIVVLVGALMLAFE